MKVGDVVVIEKNYVNATLYRILKIDGDMAEIALVKFEEDDVPDGIAKLSELFHPSSKQREANKGKGVSWTAS